MTDREHLLTSILSLHDLQEAQSFFSILSDKEIEELTKRWKAARMLDAGVPYSKIERELGLSSRTVARVSKWLQGGRGISRVMRRNERGQ